MTYTPDHHRCDPSCRPDDHRIGPTPDAGDWYQDDDGRWSTPSRNRWIDLAFYEDEIADWPPLVALRADNARLRTAIERHRRAKWDELLYAALNPDEDQ